MRERRRLEIRLLGHLEMQVNGVPVRLAGRHAQALVALLALRARPRLRDTLATELWPDAGSPSAAALRQALWLIRQSLDAAGTSAEHWLMVTPDTIGFDPAITLELDIDEFERLAASPDLDDHALAIRTYRGDLLEGFGHECFAAERERLADAFEDLLARVAQECLDRGDYPAAQRAASALLVRDPLREEAHGVLIAAYGQVGTRAQVVRQYRKVCAILEAELEVAPLPETEAAYRRALARSVARSAERVGTFTFDPAGYPPRLVNSA